MKEPDESRDAMDDEFADVGDELAPVPSPRQALPILAVIDAGLLPRTSPHACVYLPGRDSIEEGFTADEIDPELYHELMNHGFRRSGRLFYRPRCEGCEACVSLRVPVDRFEPTRSQRRAFRRNADVAIKVGPPTLTGEKHRLYEAYLAHQHAGSPQACDIESLREFLYTSPVDTREIEYRLPGGSLLGVSIVDLCSRSMSSVYHFFDPAHARRSCGVYSVVAEIELCRQWGVPHYYLGFWVAGCQAMAYKSNYQPHERLVDGRWA